MICSVSVSWEPPPSLGDQHTRETFCFLASAVSNLVFPPSFVGEHGLESESLALCSPRTRFVSALHLQLLPPTLKLSEMCITIASRGCRPPGSSTADMSAGVASCLCKQLQAVGISVQSLAKGQGTEGWRVSVVTWKPCLENLLRRSCNHCLRSGCCHLGSKFWILKWGTL